MRGIGHVAVVLHRKWPVTKQRDAARVVKKKYSGVGIIYE
jgi:hypothetical protein